MTIDVYNIIRQLTDQEDPISGQMKRECFNELIQTYHSLSIVYQIYTFGGQKLFEEK